MNPPVAFIFAGSKDVSFWKILGFVLGMHLAVFLAMEFSGGEQNRISQQKKLKVQTVSLKPQKAEVMPPSQKSESLSVQTEKSVTETKPIQKKEEPKKESIPQKKPVQKVVSSPKKAPAPKPIVKKSPPKPISKTVAPKSNPAEDALKKKQRELLAKAKDKMGQVATAQKNIQSDLEITRAKAPKKIESLHIDAEKLNGQEKLTVEEISYRDELALRLKLLLHLPEYGEVKLKLTLDRSGKVNSVKILHSKSPANKAYVEKTLIFQKMPPFGNNFGQAKEYTFAITLINE